MTYPNTPGHKAGAPETSKQAASEIKSRAGPLHDSGKRAAVWEAVW